MSKSTGNILELVTQLASLQRTVTPALPEIGKKLVADLIATGVPAKKIARVIKRSPTYVYAVADGAKALTAQNIVNVVQYAVSSQRRKEEADAVSQE
jgi:hypothetical protein